VAEPTARVVILGASNVTRGAAALVGEAVCALAGPVEFLIARGHGRSYGAPSRVLWRGLPGIVQCGLWEALDRGPSRPTYALVTDIGNDVMYGASVDEIVAWARACLERLAGHGARTVLSLLPMESLSRLRPWQFRAMRSVLFPGRRMSFGHALDTARRLDERLRSVALGLDVSMVEPPGAWYGVDPIHPYRWRLGQVWRTMLAPWTEAPPPVRPRPRPGLWLRLVGLTPERWSLAGLPRGRPQPSARLPDGSTLSFY
jgi:hypothetical protein